MAYQPADSDTTASGVERSTLPVPETPSGAASVLTTTGQTIVLPVPDPTKLDAQTYSAAENDRVLEILNDHAERAEARARRTFDFGDGTATSFDIAHPLSGSVSALVLSNATHTPVGIHADAVSNSGRVLIGPFDTAPMSGAFKLIVEKI